MNRSTRTPRRSRRVGLGLAFAVALLSLPAPALGLQLSPPYHVTFSGPPYVDVVCGIPVVVYEEGEWTNTEFVDRNGRFLFRGTAHLSRTYTATDGDAVTVIDSNQLTFSSPIVDEVGGTITFVETLRGVLENMKLANGSVLFVDAGYATNAITFDLTTGNFISFESIVAHGGQPLAQSGFTLWCEAFIEALG
jgi:hypothetical protein